MDLNQTVCQLDAAAESSRLRLLAVLLTGETPVGDLVAVLEQSQPRVSRHLRLLAEAGLVESFREGRSIFYRWSGEGLNAGLAASVATLAASSDPTIVGDRDRLRKLARQRARDGLRRSLRAGEARDLHPPVVAATAELDELLQTTLGAVSPGDLLHVGCGSGALLELLLPRARHATGTDPSRRRRQLARARLRHAGLPRWTIRDGEAWQLPFSPESFDLVILQGALAGATNAQAALADAVRVLRPAGRLLVLDRILPTDSDLAARLDALGLQITRRQWLPGRAPDRAVFLATRAAARLAARFARTGTDD